LLRQRQKQLKSGFVFPSNLSKAGHIQDPKKAWKRLLAKAELSNLRIHDIRRTLGSYQAITGASLQIIGKSLGHKSSKATEIYSRLLLDPVRFSMDKAAEMIFAKPITVKEE
jgi:integrase